jgi:hypothetical protein
VCSFKIAVTKRNTCLGGQCDRQDRDWTAILVRECSEESQVPLIPGSISYLGPQVVTGDPGIPASYMQVRLFAVFEEFAARAPDPDGGRIYQRLMTSLEAAPGVLGWGGPAVAQARPRPGSPGESGGFGLMRLLLRVTRTEGC